MSVYSSVCISVLSAYLHICVTMSVCVSFCLFVCLVVSVSQLKKASKFINFPYGPLLVEFSPLSKAKFFFFKFCWTKFKLKITSLLSGKFIYLSQIFLKGFFSTPPPHARKTIIYIPIVYPDKHFLTDKKIYKDRHSHTKYTER